MASLIIGLILVLAGLFFMAVPGPGLLIALAGLLLLATVSRRTARLLDRSEILLHRMAQGARRRWTGTPRALKLLLTALAVFAIATLGYALLLAAASLQG